MNVREILGIENTKMPNMERATLITKMLKARARRHNPKDSEEPTGWNASPYPGSSTATLGRG